MPDKNMTTAAEGVRCRVSGIVG